MEAKYDKIVVGKEDEQAIARHSVETDIDKKAKAGMKCYLSKGSMTVQLRPGAKTMIDGKAVFERDLMAKFDNCILETDDKEVQELLESHRLFGVDFFWHPKFANPKWTGRGGQTAKEVAAQFDFAWKDKFAEIKRRHDLAAEFEHEAHPRDGVPDEDPLSGHPGVEMKVEKKKKKEPEA